MDTQIQKQVFLSMKDPQFYPHNVSTVQQAQTHISRVFLTGKYVYKIKRAIDFGFVNFATLEKRRYYCCREVILNRRLTSGIYLDVVPITRNNGMLAIGGKGQPVEYAVRMRQLENSKSISHLIATGEINRVDMVALGTRLSRFYQQTPESELLHVGEGWENVYESCLGNFTHTQDSCGKVLNAEIWEMVKGATLSFLKNHRTQFNERVKAGKIRDCHGDLRADHIYFTNRDIQIIDCIEFNDYFRHIDVICDLAFLLMDLDFEGEPGLGDCLLSQFLKQTKDFQAILMLPFYKCYRAMVRCKVNCIYLKSNSLGHKKRQSLHLTALKYLDLAFQYALQFFRPRIWVVCGMPASGKSTFAKALSKILGIDVIRSDVIRKQIFGLQSHENGLELFGEKIYSSLAGSLTYGKLLCLAQEQIAKGCSIILDATYSEEKYRKELFLLAREKGIKPVFIECHAKESILKQRLLERQFYPSASDAGIDQFERLTARYERFRYAGNALHIRVDTSLPVDAALRQVMVQAFRMDADHMIDADMTQAESKAAIA